MNMFGRKLKTLEQKSGNPDISVATTFNNIFVNVGPSIENSIPKVPNISPSKFLKNRAQINFLIAHVSNEELTAVDKTNM